MKKIDATQGSLTKYIFAYTFPLILSTILQSLFSIADKAVLGNLAGTVAVASVAATGTVSSLIINGAVGLSSGTSIVLARFIGQKDEQKIRATIDTSLITSLALGLLVAVLGFFLAPVFLTVTNCPADCFDGAVLYMRITLMAAPATLLYNYGAAILRVIGDTKRPLLYVMIAGVINVTLNVILCVVLPQKVLAVAIATVASTVVSAVLVMRRLCRMQDSSRVELSKMRFEFAAFKRVFRFGVPAAISNLVLPLGNLQISAAINSYGTAALAGHSAACSVETVAFAFSSGFSSATMVFMGQNIGARSIERVRRSFWLCMTYSFFLTGTVGLISYLSGEFWIGVIIGNSSAAAVEYGMMRLFYVLQFIFINAISGVLTGSLRAFGYPFLTSMTNIAFTLGFRVGWMQFIYPLFPRFETIMLSYTVSWILNAVFYIICVFVIYRKYVKTGICKKI